MYGKDAFWNSAAVAALGQEKQGLIENTICQEVKMKGPEYGGKRMKQHYMVASSNLTEVGLVSAQILKPKQLRKAESAMMAILLPRTYAMKHASIVVRDESRIYDECPKISIL